MKQRCTICGGKGGYVKMVGWFQLFVSCVQCKGKGRWWPNNRPKKKERVP